LCELSAALLRSIDPDVNAAMAIEKFQLPKGQDPTDAQLDLVERERMEAALRAFHDPRLGDAILAAKRSLEQVIDEQTPDQLIRAGFDLEALEKARTLVTTFGKFIEDNRDEIEALQVLYSRPYRAGLKFRHVKDLATKLGQPPFMVNPNRPESLTRLWQAYEMVEPHLVKGSAGSRRGDC
jgi:type I restriction enzyme R subunit